MPILFDEVYYLQSKVKQLNANNVPGGPHSTTSVKAAMAEAGMTPEQHFGAFGKAEGVSPNKLFNEAEYLAAKKAALAESDPAWASKTIAELKTEMAKQGLTAFDHYAQFGAFETKKDGSVLNPSNAFDANAFFAAKLAELQKTNFPGADKMSVADVVKGFQEQGLDPVSHYGSYSAAEAKAAGLPMVQTVPVAQRVENDPLRSTGTPDNVAANYNQPTTGALNAAAKPTSVTKPADSTGLNGTPPPSPTTPVKTPADTGFVAPPANIVDDGKNTIFPPTANEGTGPNASWVVVDPAKPGEGTVINNNGTVQGTVDIKPGTGGTPKPPAAGDSVVDSSGKETNTAPKDESGTPVDPPKPDPTPDPTPDPKPDPKPDPDPEDPTPPTESDVKAAMDGENVKFTGTTGNATTVQKFAVKDDGQVTVDGTDVTDVKLTAGKDINAADVTGTSTFTLDAAAATATLGNVTGSATAKNDITVNNIGKFTGGASADKLTVVDGGSVTELDFGAGNDTMSGVKGAHVINSTGTLTATDAEGVTLELADKSVLNNLNTTDKADTLTINKDAKVSGTINMGAGDDVLTITEGAVLAGIINNMGAINMGAGDDVLTADGNVTTGAITVGAGADIIKIGDNRTLTANVQLTGNATAADANSLTLKPTGGGAVGTLKGNITGSGTADTLTINTGVDVDGNVSMGAGNDTLTLVDGGGVIGTVDMGAGTDVVKLEGYTNLADTKFTGVETLELNTNIKELKLKADTFVDNTTIKGVDPRDVISFAKGAADWVTTPVGADATVDGAGKWKYDAATGKLTYWNGKAAVTVTFTDADGKVPAKSEVKVVGNELVWGETTELGLKAAGTTGVGVTGALRAADPAASPAVTANDSVAVDKDGKVSINGTAVAETTAKLTDTNDLDASTVAIGSADTLNLDTSAFVGKHTVKGSGTAHNIVKLGTGATAYTGGEGADTITLAAGATALKLTDDKGDNELKLDAAAANTLALDAASKFTGKITGGDKADSLTITNKAVVTGTINLGKDKNTLDLGGNILTNLTVQLTGNAANGADNDLTINGTADGSLKAITGSDTANSNLDILHIDGAVTVGNIDLGAGKDVLDLATGKLTTISVTLTGNDTSAASDAANSLTITGTGTLDGAIKGSGAADRLIIEAGVKATGTGEIDLGAGDDVVSVKGADTASGTPPAGNTIIGGIGADWIRGGDGEDAIYAAANVTGGDDIIAAGTINAAVLETFNNGVAITTPTWSTAKALAVLTEANVLEGGRGNDILHASNKKDVFLFQTGGEKTVRDKELSFKELGADTIHGFTVGTDKLMIVDQDSGDADGSGGTQGIRGFSADWAFKTDAGSTKKGTLEVVKAGSTTFTGLTWEIGNSNSNADIKVTMATVASKVDYTITFKDTVLAVDQSATALTIKLVGLDATAIDAGDDLAKLFGTDNYTATNGAG